MKVVYPRALLNGRAVRAAEVQASLAVPWRLAQIQSVDLAESLRLELGYHAGRMDEVFSTSVADDLGANWRQTASPRLRGLPHWRKVLGPKSFQDGRLETVLQWLARECGGRLDLNVTGKPLRHYQVRRGPAYRAVQEALSAWRVDATLLELDGGHLHVGPADQTPYALAPVQARLLDGQNLLKVVQVSAGQYRLVIPGMAWLRCGHHIYVRHPLYTGEAQITELTHRWHSTAVSTLEVRTG